LTAIVLLGVPAARATTIHSAPEIVASESLKIHVVVSDQDIAPIWQASSESGPIGAPGDANLTSDGAYGLAGQLLYIKDIFDIGSLTVHFAMDETETQ